MFGNKNKSKTAKTPLAELQNLQSELHSLREKHITALDQELLLLEKEEVSQKSRIDKTREQLAQVKLRLKEQQDPKPSIQARTQASIDTHQAQFDHYQAELAQLRSRIFEKKLESRKEKAVLKAIIDVESALVRPEKTRSAAKRTAAATPAEKSIPKTAAARAKKPSSASPQPSPKESIAQAPKSVTKPSASRVATATKNKPETPVAVKKTPSTVTASRPKAVEKDYKAAQRRVRRMSDIPSHPDKPSDRLASLFDDF
jgi:chromosome segregation ATPase